MASRLPFALLLAGQLFPASSSTRCLSVTANDNTGGSCTFETGWCGYDKTTSDRYGHNWFINHRGRDSFAALVTSDLSEGSYAIFTSPLLCATGSDVRLIQFDYTVENPSRSQLSIDLAVGSQKKMLPLWDSSSESSRRATASIYFRCPSDNFQIIFKGKTISSRWNFSYNEIKIKLYKIKYDVGLYADSVHGNITQCPTYTTTIKTTTRRVTTTARPTATKPTTTSVTSPKTPPLSISATSPTTITSPDNCTSAGGDPEAGREGRSSSGPLDSGIIAAIVVVVLVVCLVAAIVGGALVWRRMSGKTPKHSPDMPNNAVANYLYAFNANGVVNLGLSARHPDIIPQAAEGNVYEDPPSRRSSAVYAEPSDMTLTRLPPERVSGQGHISLDVNRCEDGACAGRTSPGGNAGKTSEAPAGSKNWDSYNRLNEQEPRRKDGTYDHVTAAQDRPGAKSGTLDSHVYYSLTPLQGSVADSFECLLPDANQAKAQGLSKASQPDRAASAGRTGPLSSASRNVSESSGSPHPVYYSLSQVRSVSATNVREDCNTGGDIPLKPEVAPRPAVCQAGTPHQERQPAEGEMKRRREEEGHDGYVNLPQGRAARADSQQSGSSDKASALCGLDIAANATAAGLTSSLGTVSCSNDIADESDLQHYENIPEYLSIYDDELRGIAERPSH